MKCKPCQEARIRKIIKKLRQLKAKKNETDQGKWITSKGNKIFIPDGKDVGDALKEHFDNLNKSKSKEPTPEEKYVKKVVKQVVEKYGKNVVENYDEASESGSKAWMDTYPNFIQSSISVSQFFTYKEGKDRYQLLDTIKITDSDLKKFGLKPMETTDGFSEKEQIMYPYLQTMSVLNESLDKNDYKQLIKMWNHIVEKNPELKERVMFGEVATSILNQENKKRYDNNKYYSRGTTTGELESYLNTGKFGTNKNSYNYTAMSLSHKLANQWNSDVVIDYYADDIRPDTELVPYTLKPQPLGSSMAIKGESKKDLKSAMSVNYSQEREVRMMDGKSIWRKDGKSKIHKIKFALSGKWNKKMTPEQKSEMSDLKSKYSELADILEFEIPKTEGSTKGDGMILTASDESQIKRIMNLLGVSEKIAKHEIERWGYNHSKTKSLNGSQKKKVKNIIKKLKQLQAKDVQNTSELHKTEHYREGDTLYLKTFLINDKRNNNGWRASWNSIKKNVKSFIDTPGIEYYKCGKYGCLRDHTDEKTLDENIKVQEDYRVSTIVGTVLDDLTHTAYAIHRIDNKDFEKLIEQDEVRYLSPSIWPNKEKTILYLNDDDEWNIDTTDWKGVHDAWVDNPAFGHEARIIGKCYGGDECVAELSGDKLLVGRNKGYLNKGLNQINGRMNWKKLLKAKTMLYAGKIRKMVILQEAIMLRASEQAEEGRWITSNGHKIFIPKGKDVGEAVKERFDNVKSKGDSKKEEKPTEKKQTKEKKKKGDDKLDDKDSQKQHSLFHDVHELKNEMFRESDRIKQTRETYDKVTKEINAGDKKDMNLYTQESAEEDIAKYEKEKSENEKTLKTLEKNLEEFTEKLGDEGKVNLDKIFEKAKKDDDFESRVTGLKREERYYDSKKEKETKNDKDSGENDAENIKTQDKVFEKFAEAKRELSDINENLETVKSNREEIRKLVDSTEGKAKLNWIGMVDQYGTTIEKYEKQIPGIEKNIKSFKKDLDELTEEFGEKGKENLDKLIEKKTSLDKYSMIEHPIDYT